MGVKMNSKYFGCMESIISNGTKSYFCSCEQWQQHQQEYPVFLSLEWRNHLLLVDRKQKFQHQQQIECFSTDKFMWNATVIAVLCICQYTVKTQSISAQTHMCYWTYWNVIVIKCLQKNEITNIFCDIFINLACAYFDCLHKKMWSFFICSFVSYSKLKIRWDFA